MQTNLVRGFLAENVELAFKVDGWELFGVCEFWLVPTAVSLAQYHERLEDDGLSAQRGGPE